MKPFYLSLIIVLVPTVSLGYNKAYVRPREELARVERQLKEAKAEQDLRYRVASLFDTFETRRQHLAPQPDPDWLLQEVGRLADEAGIDLSRITPERPQRLADSAVVGVSLQFTAPYPQLAKFLSRLEAAERLIQVDELQITPDHTQPEEGPVHVRLVLSTVYVPALEATAPGP